MADIGFFQGGWLYIIWWWYWRAPNARKVCWGSGDILSQDILKSRLPDIAFPAFWRTILQNLKGRSGEHVIKILRTQRFSGHSMFNSSIVNIVQLILYSRSLELKYKVRLSGTINCHNWLNWNRNVCRKGTGVGGGWLVTPVTLLYPPLRLVTR